MNVIYAAHMQIYVLYMYFGLGILPFLFGVYPWSIVSHLPWSKTDRYSEKSFSVWFITYLIYGYLLLSELPKIKVYELLQTVILASWSRIYHHIINASLMVDPNKMTALL